MKKLSRPYTVVQEDLLEPLLHQLNKLIYIE